MGLVITGMTDGKPFAVSLRSSRYRIGRDPTKNEVILLDPTVSREHAEILLTEDRIEIRDLGSRNGTWVDGTRVHNAAPLRAGQTIRLGKIELLIAQESILGLIPPLPDAALLTDAECEFEECHCLDPESPEAGPIHEIDDDRLFATIMEAERVLGLGLPINEAVSQLSQLLSGSTWARRAMVLLAAEGEDASPTFTAQPRWESGSGRLIASRSALARASQESRQLHLRIAGDRAPTADESGGDVPSLSASTLVPLRVGGRGVGLLYLESPDRQQSRRTARCGMARLLADLVALTIGNRMLRETRGKYDRMKHDAELAATVQNRLLSGPMPDLDAYEVAVRQTTCYEVGGDLYDISTLHDGKTAIVLGDVAGKGLPAALLMSSVVLSLRLLYEDTSDPTAIATRLHRLVLQSSEPSRYVTLFLGVLDSKRHCLTFVNAGHCPPLLMTEGTTQVLESTGPPIGLLPGASYTAGSVGLPQGALLGVFSDGILEAFNGDVMYGDELLQQALARNDGIPLDDLLNKILRDVRGFLNEEPFEDDVTSLLLRRR